MIAIPIRALPLLLICIACLAAPGCSQAEKVTELLIEKAQRGDAQAQNNLGLMYDEGEGVPQDNGEAVKWYRKAAQQGNAKAQFNLALMYDEGRGVPQDYVAAYKWFNLAASRLTGETREAAVHNRESVAARMPPAQIAEAQRAARQWTREHP